MKNFITIQRLFALALAAVLILSTSVYAFAEETENPEPTAAVTPTSSPSPTPTPTTTVPPTEKPVLPTPTPSPTATPTEEPVSPTPTLSPTATPTEEPVSPTPTPSPTVTLTEEPVAHVLDEPEIPAPAYTLNIPADQAVAYKAEIHDLVCPTVSGTSGFSVGKNIKLDIVWTEFTSETVSTTIPFTMTMVSSSGASYDFSSGTVYFIGNEDGTASEYPVETLNSTGEQIPAAYFSLNFNEADWDKALPGEYKASITFSTEIIEQ